MSRFPSTSGSLTMKFALIFAAAAQQVAGATPPTDWVEVSPGAANTEQRQARVNIVVSSADRLELRLDLPGVRLERAAVRFLNGATYRIGAL